MKLPPKLLALIDLTRINRPIGIYLVLWPTLWSLWLAAEGLPDISLLVVFVLGCVLMRSAGCILNDYADRKLDGGVRRTRKRPLVTGAINVKDALLLCLILCTLSFILVLLFTNFKTLALSVVALLLAASYPFMKRFTHLPQVVLGAAFAWSIPMAFAAQTGELPMELWVIFTAVLIWTVCYDTFYAMVDREDDIKMGIKSTAVLLGDMDKLMTMSLQVIFIFAMILVGMRFELSWPYFLSLVVASGFFVYQQWLIKDRNPQACFKAFLNNNWVGITIFVGIVCHYQLSPAMS